MPREFFFSSRRRHTRYIGDWSSDVCSSDLRVAELDEAEAAVGGPQHDEADRRFHRGVRDGDAVTAEAVLAGGHAQAGVGSLIDAAPGTETGVVYGLGYVLGVAEPGLEFLHATRLQVLPGGQADGGLEGPL